MQADLPVPVEENQNMFPMKGYWLAPTKQLKILPEQPEKSSIILLGKRVQLKNIIGNMILNSKDAFVETSNDFESKEKKIFKIIKTPDFFDEECWNLDQQIIDLMARSHPGPKLFILAIDLENTQEEKVMAQIKQLQNTFGEKITDNLAVTLPDIESFHSLGHLKEKFSIQLTVAHENLTSKCIEWCSSRQPFQYDYKSYIEDAVNRRKQVLETRSGDGTPSYNHLRTGAASSCVTASQFESAEEQALVQRLLAPQTPALGPGSKSGDSLESLSAKPSKSLKNIRRQFQLKPGKKHHQYDVQKEQSESNENGMSDVIFNIVLLGKSGAGKSASANTILAAVTSKRSKCFKSEASSLPVTTQCQEREVQLPTGMTLRVVDTPDFFYERLQNCQKQIEECKKYCQEEHCILLVVLQVSRVTDDETEILENLEDTLGCKIRHKTVVLLTHGDDLNKQQSSLDKFIDQHDSLKKMTDLCSSRYHLFNNKSRDTNQVKELFEKIPDYENYFPKLKKKTAGHECSLC